MAVKKYFLVFYFLFFIGLLFYRCNSSNVQEGKPYYVKEPKENPIYLTGRLPGKGWIEHDPPKFSSNQSFEALYGWEKVILFVRFEKNERSPELYSQFIYENLAKQKGIQNSYREKFITSEGIWLKSTLVYSSGYYDLYVIRKKDYLIAVHYIAGSDDTYHHFSKDAANYVKNFWFLYDAME